MLRRSALLVGVMVLLAACQPSFLRVPSSDRNFPDPFVLQVDGMFYAYATNTDAWHVPVMVSDDLSSWSEPVDALPDLPDWAAQGAVWAPGVIRLAGRYVLYFAASNESSGRHCIDAVVSNSPTGPFTDPDGAPMICGYGSGNGSIDPYPFVAPDGNAYIYWTNTNTEYQLWGALLSSDGLQVASWPILMMWAFVDWEAGWIENPAMDYSNGYYRLFYSGDSWWDGDYATGMALCEGPLGPCLKLTLSGPWMESRGDVAGPGGMSLFTDSRGWRWVAYHAWQSDKTGYSKGGRRALHVEPISFASGWPVLVNHSPFGTLDSLSPWLFPGSVWVRGWALDQDTGRWVVIRVNDDHGEFVTEIWADNYRPDLPGHYPHSGVWRGISDPVPVSAGPNTLCFEAVDDVPADNVNLGCEQYQYDDTPIGALELAEVAGNEVHLGGWILDPDTHEPANVRVRADDQVIADAPAEVRRDDIWAQYFWWGPFHGFELDLSTSPGTSQLCVDAVSRDGDRVVELACVPLGAGQALDGEGPAAGPGDGGGVGDPPSTTTTSATVPS